MIEKLKVPPKNSLEKPEKSSLEDLALERKKAMLQAEKRRNKFIDILSGRSTERINFLRRALFGLGSIVCMILPSLAITLIPVHNVVENPEYWYEYPIQLTFICLPGFVANIVIRSSFYLNVKLLREPVHYLMVLIGTFIILFASFVIGFVVWCKIGNWQFPIPFFGIILTLNLTVGTLVIICKECPDRWRKENGFRKRLRHLMIAILLNQYLPAVSIFLIGFLFSKVPTTYQITIALFLPIVRELNVRLSSRFATQATSGDVAQASLSCTQAMATVHAMILLYTVGSIATLETSALILGIDFLINILMSCKIVYLKKMKKADIDNQIELLQGLVINEMIELVLPLSQLTCLLAAYFGPNADIIGNIGSEYWQYSSIEDIDHTIRFVLMFFFVDLISLLLSGIVLWRCSNIYLHQAFFAIQEEFGVAFTIQIGVALSMVSMKISCHGFKFMLRIGKQT